MLFCSTVFFIFFLFYFLVWLMVPHESRRWVIIVGGLVFYAYWNWHFAIIPVMLTLISYMGGKWIDVSGQDSRRRGALAISVALIISPLFFFKYFNFFAGEKIVTVGLPLGISFITFTLIAYLVDVYRRSYPVESSLSWLMGYLLFFPQLIAGPILRPAELLPQLKKSISVPWHTRYQAFCIFTLGMVKKLIFADQVRLYVEHAFQTGGRGFEGLIALYTFPVQLYCDFSGYSDMAIGLALFFGIHLPLNFDRPYLATSFTDVWRRWHITLSYWFRDYVYYPLIGRGSSDFRKISCKILTMVLCGFWHGASWTFLTWGFLNGVYLGLEHFLRRFDLAICLPDGVKRLVIFHMWAVAVVFIPAYDMSNAFEILGNIFTGGGYEVSNLASLAYPFVLTVIFFVLHPFDSIRFVTRAADRINTWWMVSVMLLLWLTAIMLSTSNGGSATFIYFEF